MERFLLTEMVLRGTKLVPARDEGVKDLSWDQLCEIFAMRDSDRRTLRLLRSADFIGVKRRDAGRSFFYLSNTDRSGRVAWLLKKTPTALVGLEYVYRVESAQYAGKIVEMAS